jgi:Flp pilus assembly protein TadD
MYGLEEIDAAREYVGRAGRVAPDGFVLAADLVDLGACILFLDGNTTLAEEGFRAAFEAEPQNPTIGRDLALFLAHTGRTEEARTVLDQALELSPDDKRLLEVREYVE